MRNVPMRASPKAHQTHHNEEASASDTDERSSACSTLSRKRPTAYAFILPNFDQFSDDFRRFLERDLIELATLRRLEQSGALNWWCTTHNASQRLYPLVTSGDGNCLLHAASLGSWGVHDRGLNLRQMLHEALSSKQDAFYRRWRWHESKSNLQSELILDEKEWKSEWEKVLSISSPTPRSTNSGGGDHESSGEQIYEFLELIHVFVLATVLRRPILVVADTVLRNASNEPLGFIPFSGIFLPLEASAQQCQRSPLVLCYDQSHFSALVAMRQTSSCCPQAVPITDRNRNLLPVHFDVDPGADFTWFTSAEDQKKAAELDAQQTDDRRLELINRYMDIVKMNLRRGSVRSTTPISAHNEATPAAPIKSLTLASGATHDVRGGAGRHGSRLISEIWQHVRGLRRRSKRAKTARSLFSASDLRATNSVLTALLHNNAHQHANTLVNTYLNNARQRFERARLTSTSTTVASNSTPKTRISRSLSSSSVLLACLNPRCDAIASPATNFLCAACFDEHRNEALAGNDYDRTISDDDRLLHNSSTVGVTMQGARNGDLTQSVPSSTSASCSKSATMPTISARQRKASEQSTKAATTAVATVNLDNNEDELPLRPAAAATSSTRPHDSSSLRFNNATTTIAARSPFYYDKFERNSRYLTRPSFNFDGHHHSSTPLARSAPFARTYDHDYRHNNDDNDTIVNWHVPPVSVHLSHSLPRPTLSRPYRSNNIVYSSSTSGDRAANVAASVVTRGSFIGSHASPPRPPGRVAQTRLIDITTRC